MITIHKIETADRRQARRFIDLPYRLYRDGPQWVSPLRGNMALALNRAKHPVYEHSAADFFVATRDGRLVGRIAALDNTRYNATHGTRTVQFYFFECEDDGEAAAIFGAVFDRARAFFPTSRGWAATRCSTPRWSIRCASSASTGSS